MRTLIVLTAILAIPAAAQAPLEKSLAHFDQLASQLKTGSVMGEPIRVGDTALIPFAKIAFSLGAGGAAAAFGGGLSGTTVPLGVLIVEGDDVRVESFPEPEEKPGVLTQILQAILDRKVTFMANGVNLGNTTGTIQDLAPLVTSLTGQTVLMANAVNLGNLNPPRAASAQDAKKNAETDLARGVARLHAPPGQGRDLDGAIADIQAALARKPSPEGYYYLGEAFRAKGSREQAATAYRKALELKPNYPEAASALAALNETKP